MVLHRISLSPLRSSTARKIVAKPKLGTDCTDLCDSSLLITGLGLSRTCQGNQRAKHQHRSHVPRFGGRFKHQASHQSAQLPCHDVSAQPTQSGGTVRSYGCKTSEGIEVIANRILSLRNVTLTRHAREGETNGRQTNGSERQMHGYLAHTKSLRGG